MSQSFLVFFKKILDKLTGKCYIREMEKVKDIVDRIKSGEKEFKKYYLSAPAYQCDVQDGHGNNCPDKPVHFFVYKERKFGLCKRCYILYQIKLIAPPALKLRTGAMAHPRG